MENDLIDGMMNFLKSNITQANAIVLLLSGKEERFDSAFQQTIRYNFVLLCCSYLENVWIFKKYVSEKWKLCLENHFGNLQSSQ